MACHVVHGLLYQTEQRERAQFVQRTQVGVDRHLDGGARQPRPPVVETMLERRSHAQFIEPGGAQLADETRHDGIDAIHSVDHRSSGALDERVIGSRGVANRHRVEFDHVQVLAELVVQIARQRFALGFLHVHVLLRQPLILRQHIRQLHFDRPAQPKLAPRLEIPA